MIYGNPTEEQFKDNKDDWIRVARDRYLLRNGEWGSSVFDRFDVHGWLLVLQQLDWVMALQEPHAALPKDWGHWLHVGLKAITPEKILALPPHILLCHSVFL
jgi:hypothetical protein